MKLNKYLHFIFGNNRKELILLRLDFRFDAVVANKKIIGKF